jgi:hypothetical protein
MLFETLPEEAVQTITRYIEHPFDFFRFKRTCRYIHSAVPSRFVFRDVCHATQCHFKNFRKWRRLEPSNLTIQGNITLGFVISLYRNCGCLSKGVFAICESISDEELGKIVGLTDFNFRPILSGFIDRGKDVLTIILQNWVGELSCSRVLFALAAAITGGINEQSCLLFAKRFMSDPNHNHRPWSIIRSCIVRNYPLLLDYLLYTGTFDLNASYDQEWPLQVAVERGTLEVVEVLLRGGANVTRPRYRSGFSSLVHSAINRADPEFLYLLHDFGADFNTLDFFGFDALHILKHMVRGEEDDYRREKLEICFDFVSQILG